MGPGSITSDHLPRGLRALERADGVLEGRASGAGLL